MTAEPLPSDESLDEPASIDDLFRIMQRLATARSRIAENTATAQREHERIDVWLDEETRSDRSYAAMLEAAAVAFLRRHLDAHPDGRKSIRTPWGVVSSRAQEPKYERDDTALWTWAGPAGYTREALDWERIKSECHVRGNRLVTEDGEVIPGVEVTEREPKFDVRAG